MDSDWRQNQLNQLHHKNCIFKNIPVDIGRIVYCDSDNPHAAGMSRKKAIIQRIVTVVVFLAVMVLIWTLLIKAIQLCLILSFAAICVGYAFFDTRFRGTDYFVGTLGFAKIKFDKNRANIVKCELIRYDDIRAFCTLEKIERFTSKAHLGKYNRTVCHYSIYGHSPDRQEAPLLFKSKGFYREETRTDNLDPPDADEECRFMRVVEDMWTNIFLERHRNSAEIDFPIMSPGGVFYNHCVSIHPWGIESYGKRFEAHCIKQVSLCKDKLTIEHANHSSQMFGLIEKGHIETLPYSRIANGKALLVLLSRMSSPSTY